MFFYAVIERPNVFESIMVKSLPVTKYTSRVTESVYLSVVSPNMPVSIGGLNAQLIDYVS